MLVINGIDAQCVDEIGRTNDTDALSYVPPDTTGSIDKYSARKSLANKSIRWIAKHFITRPITLLY